MGSITFQGKTSISLGLLPNLFLRSGSTAGAPEGVSWVWLFIHVPPVSQNLAVVKKKKRCALILWFNFFNFRMGKTKHRFIVRLCIPDMKAPYKTEQLKYFLALLSSAFQVTGNFWKNNFLKLDIFDSNQAVINAVITADIYWGLTMCQNPWEGLLLGLFYLILITTLECYTTDTFHVEENKA